MESHGILSCVLFATPRQERERARARVHAACERERRGAQVVRRGNYSFFTRSAKDDEHAWTPGRTPLWKETRSSGARAGRDRAPISLALPAYRPARVLIDDFHHIRHLDDCPCQVPPRFKCLGAPLATCALPKDVCYLLRST